MNLHVINSNSSGNAYILDNGQETLLIECGVRFPRIKKALKFNLRTVVGCLVTHEHGDHGKSVSEALKAGIKVYASNGTHEALNTDSHHRAIKIQAGKEFKLGGFRVMPFDVKHDVREPLGFLINHQETGLFVFLTDSYYTEYCFPGLNNIIVEANYTHDMMLANVESGELSIWRKDRVVKSHMGLATCKGLLRANDLSQVNNILLIHLSDSNSDEAEIKREIEQETGKVVHIAVPGLTIPFNRKPF